MTTPRQKQDAHTSPLFEATPGSGLERRYFLKRSAQALGALAAGGAPALNAQAAEPIGSSFPEWSTTQGKPMSTYGLPSPFEDAVKRTVGVPYGPIAPGTGGSRTPLQALAGTITPNGLHFERHHSGVPAIDPARHTLLVHGLVRRPLVFSMAALLRYPMVSRIHFIECAGNSSQNLSAPQPLQVPAGGGDARQGAAVYAAKCLVCHGEKGKGQLADALVGGIGSLATAKPARTVGSFWPYATTLFDYTRRAMPLQNPKSLTDEEVYAVSAYILYLNGIIAENAQMNAQTLPQVRMPNRDGFVDYSRK